MVYVQIAFTGIAIISPHRFSLDRVRQCTSKVSVALTNLDPRWRQSIGAPRRPWLHGSQHRSRTRDTCRRRWDALIDLRSERQLESEISLWEAAIAFPFAISPNSKMLYRDASSRWSPSKPCRTSLAVPQGSINQQSPIEVSVTVFRLSLMVI